MRGLMPFTRHHLHISAYFSVALCLMLIGCVFSAFAIFVKDSELGKVWLAGPTTIAVGLVLCGKVIIDCRPPGHDIDDDDSYMDEENAFAFAYNKGDEEPVVGEKDVITSIDAAYQLSKNDRNIVLQNSTSFNNNRTPGDKDNNCSMIWNPRSDANSLASRSVSPCDPQLHQKRPRSVSVMADRQILVDHTPRRSDSLRPNTRPCSQSRPISRSSRRRSTRAEASTRTPLYQGETFVFHGNHYMI